MAVTTGFQPILALAGTHKQQIQQVIDLIPNPDAAHGSGSVAGGGQFLDEMSPGAAAQLRVELAALKASIADAA